MKYTSLFGFCISILAFGCNKNDTKSEPTKTDVITQASWKYDNSGIDQDRNGTIDLQLPANYFPACVTDNTLTLSANGTGVVDEGTTKCTVSDPQSLPITWSLADNETALKIGSGRLLGISGQFRIIELSSTKLTLAKDTTAPIIGTPIAVIAVLKH